MGATEGLNAKDMEILIILLLILLNGLFAMSEIAMVSARKSRLATAAKRGDKAARRALDMAEDPGNFLSTIQIGITVIGIFLGIYSGEKLEGDLQAYLEGMPALSRYAKPLSVTIILVVLTYFSLILGELVPKKLGLLEPEKIARAVSLPMNLLSRAAGPFVWFLSVSTNMLVKLFRIKPSTEGRITEEEIKAIIQEGTEEGAIDAIEQDIVERVFNMGDRKVASLMTHRNHTVCLRGSDDPSQVRKTVGREMHSAYPVLEADTGKVLGVVELKTLFRHINDEDFNLRELVSEPQYFTEGMSAYEALRLFKTSKVHQALVIDEFGEFEGIVTLNDLLEALVGDVSEFYAEEYGFVERKEGGWLVDGQYPLAEFFHRFDLDDMITDYPFNTLSGLILHEHRRLPQVGDVIHWLEFRIEIMDMDGARIDKVLVSVEP